MEILLNENVEFDPSNINIFNKETDEWEHLDEHFYLQLEDLEDEENCYNTCNGIYL